MSMSHIELTEETSNIPSPYGEKWVCPKCGHVNDINSVMILLSDPPIKRYICEKCGYRKDERLGTVPSKPEARPIPPAREDEAKVEFL